MFQEALTAVCNRDTVVGDGPITGKPKAAETKATRTTGGATEAVPGSRDLKLREVEIMSVKEAAGTCPALPR